MSRIDQSDYIIHFTKGKNNNSSENAYENFKKILADGELIGGNSMIKGGYKCVCFTESPIGCLIQDRKQSKNIVENKYFKRYCPFGFYFSKKYIHIKGGRHVIYSTDTEFQTIHDDFKWRFVRYEPNQNPDLNIDFTWEREWRIRGNLIFDMEREHINLVFPNRQWINRFIREYESNLPSDCICKKESNIVKFENIFQNASNDTILYRCKNLSDFPYTLIDMGFENYK